MPDSHVNISFSGPGYVTKAVHLLQDVVQKNRMLTWSA